MFRGCPVFRKTYPKRRLKRIGESPFSSAPLKESCSGLKEVGGGSDGGIQSRTLTTKIYVKRGEDMVNHIQENRYKPGLLLSQMGTSCDQLLWKSRPEHVLNLSGKREKGSWRASE